MIENPRETVPLLRRARTALRHPAAIALLAALLGAVLGGALVGGGVVPAAPKARVPPLSRGAPRGPA